MKQKDANKMLVYAGLLIGTVVVIFPFIWMLSTSLKNLKEVFVFPPQWIPKDPQWGNYAEVWKANNFLRYFLNSLIVSSILMVGQLLTSSLAAFAFARMNFRGKNFLFMMVLGTTMVPTEILLIPNYVIISRLHWINTYQALIVPSLGYALGIFMLRQHFMTFPKDLEDAATMDGCSRFRFFTRILMPNSKTALAVVAVFGFINSWNAYIWPLLVTQNEKMRTIQVALAAFKDAQSSGANTNWTLLMAASTIVLIPVMLIYLFCQRWIIEGHTTSGLK